MDVEARRLEASLSQKLHELSELNRRLGDQASAGLDGGGGGGGGGGDVEDPVASQVAIVEREATALLVELGRRIAQYEAGSTGGASMTLSASQRVLLQGMRDVHRRESAELRRVSASARHKLDNARLMAGVWKNTRGDLSDVEHLLRERNSIANSSNLVDNAINQASETRLALDRQKRILQKGSSRLSQLLSVFPAANNFINKIRTKQQRDRLIIAGVIALCVLFCVWWVFARRSS